MLFFVRKSTNKQQCTPCTSHRPKQTKAAMPAVGPDGAVHRGQPGQRGVLQLGVHVLGEVPPTASRGKKQRKKRPGPVELRCCNDPPAKSLTLFFFGLVQNALGEQCISDADFTISHLADSGEEGQFPSLPRCILEAALTISYVTVRPFTQRELDELPQGRSWGQRTSCLDTHGGSFCKLSGDSTVNGSD